jgi:hypothetical protein
MTNKNKDAVVGALFVLSMLIAACLATVPL